MKQGADVNGGDHEHGYSTLHFAALANKVEICQILLENGVKVDRTNSVKRTASQMAAFVGRSNLFLLFSFTFYTSFSLIKCAMNTY